MKVLIRPYMIISDLLSFPDLSVIIYLGVWGVKQSLLVLQQFWLSGGYVGLALAA